MKAWRVHQHGAPREVLRLDDVVAPDPGAGELKIRVTSVTLNFNDLDGIHGRYKTVARPVPYIPGMEVLGVVEEAGAGAEAWLGRRVVAIPSGAFGGYAEYVVAPASMAFEMPSDMPEPEAVEAVLDATAGHGVDVAFDAVSGAVTVQTFRCMAFNGRHILAGFASGIEQEDEGLVPRPVLFGNFSLVGVCHAYVDDPVVFKRLSGFNFPAHRDGEQLHAALLALFAAGKLRAIVGQEVSFGDLPAALDAMEQRQTIGRTVISVS